MNRKKPVLLLMFLTASTLRATAASSFASFIAVLRMATWAGAHASAPAVKMWKLTVLRCSNGKGAPCTAIAVEIRVVAAMAKKSMMRIKDCRENKKMGKCPAQEEKGSGEVGSWDGRRYIYSLWWLFAGASRKFD
jgi:hypothetical protein